MKKYFILILATLLFSCNNDDDMSDDTDDMIEDTSETGTLKIMFQNFAGMDELALNTEYITSNNDTIKISTLKYYVSNFMVTDTMGMTEMEVDSYHLVKTETDGEMTTWEWEIPTGAYSSFMFDFGVDSAANYSTANAAGDLDPSGADGMVWNWNTGYKFLKLEGTYNSDTTDDGAFIFHVGGDANYTSISLGETMNHEEMSMKEASSTLFSINADRTTTIHITADILNMFSSPNTIDLDVTNSAGHSGMTSPMIENIEEDVFMIHHTGME